MKKIITQTLLCTRHTLSGLLLVCLVHSGLLADKVIAQRPEEVKISVFFDKSTLVEVFQTIEAQTGFTFAYNEGNIDLTMKISLQAEDKTVEEILQEISQLANLSFKQMNQHILVRFQADTRNTSTAFLQISGKVTDQSSGSPLPGVNVNVAGTTLGTITDIEGDFHLDMPDSANRLFFLLCRLYHGRNRCKQPCSHQRQYEGRYQKPE